MIISELTNEAKELRKEVEMYSGRMNLVRQDVVALKHQVASLQQELAWRTSKNRNMRRERALGSSRIGRGRER